MTRPMAIVIINSNNVNPRFPLDFIISFEEEQQPFERTSPLVSHANTVESPSNADNKTGSGSFIASDIILGSGWEGVKALKVRYPDFGLFGMGRWLPGAMESWRTQGNRLSASHADPVGDTSPESNRDCQRNTSRAPVAGDLRVGFSELLPKADNQERTKDGRDQCKIGVGKYLFVDPSKRIRNISGKGVSNRRL